MCGIVGYIGKRKVLPILIQGLKRLEYRGYDSAGVAFVNSNKQITICKSVGRIAELEKVVPLESDATIGIGHTRWATHGGVKVENSHPHQVGDITIVHNGILENYQELKMELLKYGYQFKSDTDTEVACAYIDFLYQKSKSKDILEVLEQCIDEFVGSYAMGILVKDNPNLFVMKKDSPLIIGIGKNEYYVASDISAYSSCTEEYISLEDKSIGMITEDNFYIYHNGSLIDIERKQVNKKQEVCEKKGFPHYMLKEIYEQQYLVQDWYSNYLEQNCFDELLDISQYQKIHIIGCGTAYHAGLVGKYLLEEYHDIEVDVFIASEYRYQKLFVDEHTLVIAISQSGETADTLACIKRVKEYNAHTLGIVNVNNSSIARCVDDVIYTEAGQEVSVASTKAYTSQLFVLGMLALKTKFRNQELLPKEIQNDYKLLGNQIQDMIQIYYDSIIDILWEQDDLFYLGRNIDYVTMLEGCLKLKEITYIHSEAMPAGELKHGTISLINDESYVVVLISRAELVSKTISNVKEVRARGAKVILLALESLKDVIDFSCYDKVIWLPKVDCHIQPIVNVIPLQMIAYEVAKRRGLDIDKPRNLAKSVTVE